MLEVLHETKISIFNFYFNYILQSIVKYCDLSLLLSLSFFLSSSLLPSLLHLFSFLLSFFFPSLISPFFSLSLSLFFSQKRYLFWRNSYLLKRMLYPWSKMWRLGAVIRYYLNAHMLMVNSLIAMIRSWIGKTGTRQDIDRLLWYWPLAISHNPFS